MLKDENGLWEINEERINDVIAARTRQLAVENAMSYVLRRDPNGDNLKVGVNKSNVPLAFCSLYPSKTPYSGDKIVFDMSSFRGHVFVLSSDGSVADRGDDVVESETNDDMGELKKDVQIFQESKRGRATAQDYIVLTPETL